ncbi:Arabinanase/levansucrase/invertase [Rickenella mellea]|uniref:Arabinanase/levansucrase/invertase n=1 Tax=Rickenella mellea TaxID=50990 RepID=A0A4Y7PZY4_9AGAM|nr:Arabinanase/levansucrase/invertase [Rickenella mellea]
MSLSKAAQMRASEFRVHALYASLLLIISCVRVEAGYRAQTTSLTNLIVPGAQWRDTDGNVISAHGGGIVHVNNTFYWVGGSVGCCEGTALYSSPDLTTWTNHGIVYANDVSRPKLVFSETTGMWQILGQVGRQLDVASSANILGPYSEVGPPISPFGVGFTDFGLFLDDDGEAYALYSADHNNLVLSQISPSRTNFTKVMHQFNGVGLESPAMFKDGSTYFVIASHKTAYMHNNNVMYSAQSLTGPWSVQSYIAPSGTRTWNTQSTFALTIAGSVKTTHLYLGDRWVYPDLQNSTYVWLPMTIDQATKGVQAAWTDVFALDTETGVVSVPQGTKYEAEAGKVTGSASVASCATCSGNQLVTGIGATSTLTINNVTGRGEPQWVSFHYINTDGLFGDLTLTDNQTLALTKQRNATVALNGGTPMALPQYDTNAGIVMSVPLQLNLTLGNGNAITVASIDRQVAGDLDYIMVY